MKKGAIIGLGSVCFVVVFAVAVLAFGGSGVNDGDTITENSAEKYVLIPIIEERLRLVPTTSTDARGEILLSFKKNPAYLPECTRFANELDEWTEKSYTLEGEELMTHQIENQKLRDTFYSVCGISGVAPTLPSR